MANHGLTPEELQAEVGIALPDKEVVSIIDVNADINVGIDAASPIDLSAAANLNVAAPIQAGAGANVLTYGSGADAMVTHSADGGVVIMQTMDNVTADASSVQDSAIDQAGDTSTGVVTDPGAGTDTGTDTDTDTGATVDTGTGTFADGALLNVDVNVDLNADLAAPIAGGVAANANVAAPINAGVAANIGSWDSTADAVSIQDATITQTMNDVHATADSDQTSSIAQGGTSGTADSASGATSGGTSAGTSSAGSDSSSAA